MADQRTEYGPETYGARIADVYDDWYPAANEVMVDRLEELGWPGPALELGIGTGRVALPLAARGLEVHGIDASPEMVARLRAKPGGEAIPVTLGDFRDVPAPGEFRMVYVVFNTFFALLSQDDQVTCMQKVAERLAPDGVFVLEAFVPDLTRFVRGQCAAVTQVTPDGLRLDASQLDPVDQRVRSQHLSIAEDGFRLRPVELRYAWPSELDLMARLAGLSLTRRWGGWVKEPFTAASGSHVSVYER